MVPAASKVKFVEMLTASGLRYVEATAFVSPKWVPQMGDAAEVMAGIARKPGVCYSVLTPNMKARLLTIPCCRADHPLAPLVLAEPPRIVFIAHRVSRPRTPRAPRRWQSSPQRPKRSRARTPTARSTSHLTASRRFSRRPRPPTCQFAVTSRACSGAPTKASSHRRPSRASPSACSGQVAPRYGMRRGEGGTNLHLCGEAAWEEVVVCAFA